LESAKLHCGNVARFSVSCRPMKQVVRLDPADADSFFQLGQLLEKKAAYAPAAEAFERAALLSDNPNHWAWLALVLEVGTPLSGQTDGVLANTIKVWQQALNGLWSGAL